MRAHLIIYGIVQGVGYRYSTYRRALQLGLKGWVRNREDGSVEAVFEGQPEKVEEMIRWCYTGPRGARVTKIDVKKEEDVDNIFVNFEIRF
ncbi:MAG: acylphosphatase [Candidatus Hydrogenedentes bacterium]|nr:acylphosphatase [Candidatus Hydrogenedentota bacterium]